MIEATLGFIGAGQMARALASGFVSADLVKPDAIWASDPSEEARRGFVDQVPASHVMDDSRTVASRADVLFLAVKPQQMAAALESLRGEVSAKHLVVSIAAGVPLQRIANVLGCEIAEDSALRLVRVMPNSPCLVGMSASGYCLGAGATWRDGKLVKQLLESVGKAFEVDENMLDAVTGLSGSGPAFVYMIIEALSEGGVLAGLPREVATQLAAQTVRGAAEMVLQTGVPTGTLIERVASRGGTTVAGLEALEEGGLRSMLIAAVEAATRRSIELGKT